MTDLEIDYALAVAIGWSEKSDDPDVQVFDPSSRWTARVVVWHAEKWQTFSHKDPAVIWPIAERYNAFPCSNSSNNLRKAKRHGYPDVISWECLVYSYKTLNWQRFNADTAAKAVALAVIGSKK